ncbi:MAG: FAD:protein FMN transferase [Planctomycetaceae bacterium]|nr:FAD:protein FMN transferase [Planctomycetaceae bacterium]
MSTRVKKELNVLPHSFANAAGCCLPVFKQKNETTIMKTLCIALFFVTLFILSFTGGLAAERFEYEETAMGVPVRIILYSESQEKADAAAKEVFAEFQHLNGIMSDYDSESELSKLCADGGSSRVSSGLFTVLKEAKYYCSISDGAFDITVGPLVRLWRRSRRQKELPKQQYIDEAMQLTGNSRWEIDERTQSVKLLKQGMKLDLGGIAKGYAIDRAFEIILKHGIKRQLVDAGGDMRLGDAPPESEGWTISMNGVENVLLKNTAIAVSGDKFQFVEIHGVRYAHIIDPKTGLGLTHSCTVTVLAPTATQADALASAAYVLGKEKGQCLEKQFGNVKIHWETPNRF